jgi:hypothetical protein
MIKKSEPDPVDWAKRVNRSWIVRSQLGEHAESWIERLDGLNDGRLRKSCEIARAMCLMRDRSTDPKPWFYAGLFCMATLEEAQEFLATHRITKSLVPSMRNDAEVRLWLDRVGPETRELVDRIRTGLDQLME